MGYSSITPKKTITTSGISTPASTPYKAPVASTTFTSTPKATALMKKTGRAVPASYVKPKVK